MKATDYISKYISNLGVHTVFGYQGGNIAHMIDSISQNPDLQFVSTYNEQGAAFSACGYALESENLGVAVASSGPGAINLISGIANAYYDSIPTLFITGNVSIPSMKKSDEIRQNAFQENDIVSMVSKVTKYAVTIMNPHDLRYHLEKAIYLAKTGRPGPVLLDLPHNIQKSDFDFASEYGFESILEEQKISSQVIEDVITCFRNAKRPLLVVGGGAISTKGKQLIGELLKKWNIPVVSTLRGLEVVSHSTPNYVGFGGMYGNRAANLAIKYSDTILVLGSRLDERFIQTNDKSIFAKKKIIHVDIDPVELRRAIPTANGINCDVTIFLSELLARELPNLFFERWIKTIQNWNERYPSIDNGWTINKAVHFLSSHANENTVFTLDIGTNQMCVAQSIYLNGKQHCYTSAGHAAMGCSIPIAIGSVFASSNKTADCFVGDGALHMNIQELLMLSKYNLPVHIILNNNKCLGMIRDFQKKAFDSRFSGTVDLLQQIDYEKIAYAYNLNYLRVDCGEKLEIAVSMIHSSDPCFIELIFPEDIDTNPRIGTDMFSQVPMLSQKEMIQLEEEALSCGNIISW